jgi:hypothetical protein
MHKSILATSITAILMLTGCAKSPESTVESFYRAVSEGEITKAQTYVSSRIIGMLGPHKTAAALAEESERIRKCGGIKSIDVKLEGQGEVRSGTVMVTYAGQCPPENENVRLVKEDGKWKLGPTK